MNRAFFIMQPFSYTGACRVALDIASELIETKDYKPENIHLISPSIEDDRLVNELANCAYSMHNNISGLNIAPDDFVLLNTSAILGEYANPIFEMLGNGSLKKAFWFIHENNLIHLKNFEGIRENITHLLKIGLLEIFAPSQECAELISKYFGNMHIQPIQLFVDPSGNSVQRYSDDFSHLDFYISGNPSDGRKGQILFYTALQTAYYKHLKKHPGDYRSFTIHLTTVGNSWISQTIKILAKATPEIEFQLYPPVSFQDAQRIQKTCNVTVCTSLSESFALYIAEGMTMGHVLLRNNTADYKNQIEDGINGFLFEMHDFNELVEKIELILNLKKTSNEKLLQMSEESVKMVTPFTHKNYLEQFSYKPE
ncbi:MAG: glycosyltransferase [Candidatus Ancillula sp.]|jgi:glycosyltransferase involved in cell wall biosynthesis|nr:glycosyltransferase [Candidatus Ancillula sp.]